MVVFLDTSAIFALADSNDIHHSLAKSHFEKALKNGVKLVTHNYILLESMALLANRLGIKIARVFSKESSFFYIYWIDQKRHQTAIKEWSYRKSKVSFVDRVSFCLMKELGITTAFAFDSDFTKEGLLLYS